MPKLPQPQLPAIASLQAPAPPPMFGAAQTAGAQFRKQQQSDRARAFGGSLMGTQLASANVGGKTLLGQAG